MVRCSALSVAVERKQSSGARAASSLSPQEKGIIRLSSPLIAAGVLVALLATSSPAHPDSRTPCDTLKESKAVADAGWNIKKWRDGSPVKPRQAERLSHTGCLPASQHKKLRRYIDKLKAAFGEYRAYRKVAPYRTPGWGYGEPGPSDLRYVAIPINVVCGESEPHRRGKAAFRIPDGIYQIIPKTWRAYGGSTSNAADASPLEQHTVARRAWGETPWYGNATHCG